ncbi:hypothetical protein [Pulveribacter suum]|uniref:hypothetical protein n=1 Tax=Pulveribacter suum TaxID=2116657 RepID=UPI0013004E92|nr:hypothetical protein [Pulveribacter suum]
MVRSMNMNEKRLQRLLDKRWQLSKQKQRRRSGGSAHVPKKQAVQPVALQIKHLRAPYSGCPKLSP